MTRRFLPQFQQQTDIELPPPYTVHTTPSITNEPTNTSNIPAAVPGNSSYTSLPSRTNYLSVHRQNTGLRGTFVVDPSLAVPQSIMAPLEEGEKRKNLFLSCRNGQINSDVWLVGEGSQKATMEVQGQNGSVTMKLVRIFCYNLIDAIVLK